MGTDESYGGHKGAHGLGPKIGEPGYISVEEAARLDLARWAEFEARPEIAAKRKADREYDERKKLERAVRKKALITSTDYPWLKPDWDWDKVPLGFASRPPGTKVGGR